MPDGWEKTELWNAAESLPNTTIIRDDDGREAERFGSVTSGQTLLYDATARCSSTAASPARADTPAITPAAPIVDLLNHVSPATTATKVFGCSLFASAKS